MAKVVRVDVAPWAVEVDPRDLVDEEALNDPDFWDWFNDCPSRAIADQNLVIAHLDDGSAWCHGHAFLNDPEGAERLAARVEARGAIDTDHWFDDHYLCKSLEARLADEAVYEDMARRGCADMIPDGYSDLRG